MTAAQLRDLFVSADYTRDLTELSSCLSSIAPETPMAYCLAKHLWKNKHIFQLEAKRKDIVVAGKHIEIKGHYDFGMEKLKHELDFYGANELKWQWADARLIKKKSIGWNIALKVYEDLRIKKPDIFVWIICSRDLSKVEPDACKRICMYHV